MNEENENILEKAIEVMRSDRIPPGPPQELVDATLTKLAEAQGQADTAPFAGRIGLLERLRPVRGMARFAAAAVLFIVAGYAAGRVSAPQPPNIEQLQAALEPAIRSNVIAQLKNDLQSGLATCYEQLSDELGRRHSEDMARFAAQTLDASNSVTGELLTAMIEAINAAQTEQGQRFAAVLEQMESERWRDAVAFASFAVRTEDELQRTKQGVEQLLYRGLPEGPAAHEFEISDNPDERRNK